MAKKGHIVTEETRRKISESKRGHSYNKRVSPSEETRKKISDTLKGRKLPEETCQKMSASRMGRRTSDETKRRMSEAQKGNKNNLGKRRSSETVRKISDANRGRKATPETIKRLSESHKGNVPSEETRRRMADAHKGEKSHLWKGGISFEPYCSKFNNELKEKIRNKFNRTCVLCGKSEQRMRLAVHHVNFDKMAGCYGKAWNLVPLCQSCHAQTTNHRHYYFNLLSNYWIDGVVDKWQIMQLHPLM